MFRRVREKHGLVEPAASEEKTAAKKPELTASGQEATDQQVLRAFSHRLIHEDVGTTEKDGVFRSPDGKILPPNQVGRLFRQTLVSDCGFTEGVAWHIYRTYSEAHLNRIGVLNPLIAKFDRDDTSDAKTQFEQERTFREGVVVSEMRAIARDPKSYGINVELLDTPRNQLSSEELLGLDYDQYVIDNLSDEDNVPDPFHVNGMLPPAKRIGDSCRRIFDQLFANATREQQQARTYMKDKIILQLVRELETAEYTKYEGKDAQQQRRMHVNNAVNKMVVIMRDLLVRNRADEYVRAIETGVMPKGAPELASITKRPPYSIISIANTVERNKAIRRYYEDDLVSSYPEAEAAHLEAVFDAIDLGEQVGLETGEVSPEVKKNLTLKASAFFRDAGGAKEPIHIFFDILMVLKRKGFKEEDIQTTFVPFVNEMVRQMVEHQKAVDAEYNKGFNRSQRRINELKKELGTLRVKFIREGKKQVENSDLLRFVGGESVPDSEIDALAGVEQAEDHEGVSLPEFSCADLTQAVERKISRDDFRTAVNVFMVESMTEERARVANLLSENEQYVATRNVFEDKRGALDEQLGSDQTPPEAVVSHLAHEIVELAVSIIAFHDNVAPEMRAE